MSLADNLSIDPSTIPHHNAGCSVGKLLARLPDSEAKVLREALDDVMWPTKEIVKELHAEGYRLSSDTVGRHRRMLRGDGGCRCDVAGLA